MSGNTSAAKKQKLGKAFVNSTKIMCLAYLQNPLTNLSKIAVCSFLALSIPGHYSRSHFYPNTNEPFSARTMELVASHAQEPGHNTNESGENYDRAFKPWRLQDLILSKVMTSRPSLEYLVEQKAMQFYTNSIVKSQEYLFVIDKNLQTASVYKVTLEKVETSKVSTGLHGGEKLRQGDKKTPSGVFKVVSVVDSSSWFYNGEFGSYGNYFARLNAGSWDYNGRHFINRQSSIGIHGTNKPELLGFRASDGCIRLSNDKNNYYVDNGILRNGTIIAILPEKHIDTR